MGANVTAETSSERAHPRDCTPDGVHSSRNLAIDRLRGALVILMVAGDYLSGIQGVPSFLKHAPDVGFTVADTVASAFIFVIGLNYGPSIQRRMKEGSTEAYRYVLTRYLALIGIGAIIAAAATMTGQPTDWGVLQAIGVAGLITLLFIRLPTWARFVIGMIMLVGYQYLLDLSMLSVVLHSAHAGFFGALSWAALLVLSTAVADIWRKGTVPYIVCCATLLIAAGISAVIVPVSKHRVSLSFVLITLAISAVAFFVVEGMSRVGVSRAGILCWWGQNALTLYLVHLLVLAAFVVPPIAWWYVEAPAWLAVAQLTVMLAFMSVVAWWMHHRRSEPFESGAVPA
jgi:predicted acyltransferase